MTDFRMSLIKIISTHRKEIDDFIPLLNKRCLLINRLCIIGHAGLTHRVLRLSRRAQRTKDVKTS